MNAVARNVPFRTSMVGLIRAMVASYVAFGIASTINTAACPAENLPSSPCGICR